MFPQVAQQPHRLPTFYQSTDTTPYDSSEDSRYQVQSHQRPSKTADSFFRPRAGTFQHAIPAQHSFRSSTNFNQLSQNGTSPNPEHLLRRKTPNGTLAAGYDGTPVRWSTKPPASKQIVLPSGNLSANRTAHIGGNHIASPEDSVNGFDGTHAPAYTASMQESLAVQGSRYSPARGQYSETHWQGQFMIQTPANGGNWHPPNFSSGPFLDQLLARQQPIDFWGNSTQVPTVLQPTYQLGPGPTASNSSGHYGPYWPDGTYTPYRPAALASHHSLYNGGSVHPIDSRTFRQVSYPSRPRTDTFPSHSFGGFTSHNTLSGEGDSYSNSIEAFQTPAYQNTTVRGQARFKEKMLAWAHSVYVDLLAYLHHNKKRGDPCKRSRSRTTLYPKPPRQPLLNFDAEQNGPAHMNASQSGSISNGYGNSPYMTSFSRIVSTHDQGPPQISNARAALEIVENLCEESSWSWIEGMLLGGCLAYGLEEFTKSLKWYTKIVSIDQSHVEAISNLAATLLALNRRQEAEQHWLQSVRLRPSYFEAVEHLIGVLCDDHRGREAVDIIEFVERSLRVTSSDVFRNTDDLVSESSSDRRSSCDSSQDSSDHQAFDHDMYRGFSSPPIKPSLENQEQPGFGSSGYLISGSDNGRMLALVHAKGNMLYALGDISRASKAFEDAVLIGIGRELHGVQELISRIHHVLTVESGAPNLQNGAPLEPLLLSPDMALQTSKLVFVKHGELPGLRHVPHGMPRRAAISTTSNSLLSLAKIFQDGISNTSAPRSGSGTQSSVADILALYYLSLSLQPSPSTANNVGILLAGIQQSAYKSAALRERSDLPKLPGVVPGSGIALALAYYNYGLILDSRHAHLYTNLGSLLKDIGHLDSAITMYEQAVDCDATFDIALANLANAVKDKGRVSDAIQYYRRAVAASPDFAEAVCGLANALNSVCDWTGRGGVYLDNGRHDRWHVGERGEMIDATVRRISNPGWISRVVEIVRRQLAEGSKWGIGTLNEHNMADFLQQIESAEVGIGSQWSTIQKEATRARLATWSGSDWEGARITKLIERATRRTMHRWYQDKYVRHINRPQANYPRIRLPNSVCVPGAPTVLPFHTFTYPLSAKEIRMISQRNALRISCSTLKSPWLPQSVFMPPAPPDPHLNIGYVSSDFNNHPLSHLMQSVFGLHNPNRVKAFCYATTASDRSIHRQQIEHEAAVFRDASSWPVERLVHQILQDGIHILINLNGYTRGARNEVFAARPAPIQMSFMGYAGTTGAEWCDYLLADELTIPQETLRPNFEFQGTVLDTPPTHKDNDWVYSEKIIFSKHSFFCTDHKQSSRDKQLAWESEKTRRWKMRKNLFPGLSDDAVILGNFNQLYKIDPTTFRTWLRILAKVPIAVLWLLRFPDIGETNLRACAKLWAGEEVAARIIFTSVAAKEEHISRACIIDLFLDTPECNAHTTATDVLWSGSPILTLPRYKYKMCSRMASSILKSALPSSKEGIEAASQLIAEDEHGYENSAVALAENLKYTGGGEASGRLFEFRKLLYEHRSQCALFDTKQWVGGLENAYEVAWRNWVDGREGDIYL